SGFQNNFTGTSGNIHISWLGKLTLNNGTLMHSTYVAEYAEGTGSLGAPHPDPNLDGWPNPNGGWPNVNTTYLGKNMLKVTSSGRVVVLGQGRRTITTANAYQKMVKPANGGLSSWNNFVREYEDDLSIPLYSSLLVGQWDTLTQQGGDNVKLYGVFKNANSLLVVGKHTGAGSEMPVSNVPGWGNNTFNGESAVLARFTAANIVDPNDSPVTLATGIPPSSTVTSSIWPNPASEQFTVRTSNRTIISMVLIDNTGRTIERVPMRQGIAEVDRSGLAAGTYLLMGATKEGVMISLGKVVLR
ncbi:MAG: T9SS type A sorting domain-containing protein, partial [Flavobacteriales bacterium]